MSLSSKIGAAALIMVCCASMPGAAGASGTISIHRCGLPNSYVGEGSYRLDTSTLDLIPIKVPPSQTLRPS